MKVGADGGADGAKKGGAAGWPRPRRPAAAAAAAACAGVAVVAGLWVGGVALLVTHADVGMCVDCCGSGPAPAAAPPRYNVLLLGDSIAAGYAPFVAAELADVAAVQRGGGPGFNHSFNGGNSRRGVACVELWRGAAATPWDVVHFNHGLWDVVKRRHARRWPTVPFRRRKTWTEAMHVPAGEYAANVREIAARLANRSRAVVFATTTPLAACTPRCTPKRKRTPGRVRAYNAAAVAALPAGVRVDDLHAAAVAACGGGAFPDAGCAALPLLRAGDVHLAPAGSAALARVVAAAIRAALPDAA